MILPEHLSPLATQIINLYTSTQDGAGARLDALLRGLGYNDAGLLSAWFRGRGDTYVAERIDDRCILRTHAAPRSAHPVSSPVGCSRCACNAAMCEHVPLNTGGVAFYYYCARCWHEPGPAAPSPAERTATPACEPPETAPNREGMTWDEWRCAAGHPSATDRRLVSAWFDGVDPTELRADAPKREARP